MRNVFSEAQETVCIADAWMLQTLLESRRMPLVSDATDSLERIFCRFIARGWPEAKNDPQKFRASIFGILECEMHLMEQCRRFAEYMESHRQTDVFGAVLQKLLDGEDASGCQIVVGLMCRAAAECDARKWHVWTALQMRLPHVSGENGNELRDCVLQFLDDWKQKAMDAAFIDPTILYAHMINNSVLAGDADVHGYNTYCALLMRALQVNFSRPPLATDCVKGVVDFLSVPQFEPFAAFTMDPSNFGRKISRVDESSCIPLPVVSGTHFIFSGSTVCELVQQSFDFSARNQLHFAQYVQRFADCFREERILQPLFQHILNAGLIQRLPSDDVNGDIRYHVWDMDTDDTAHFRLDRARRIFERAGICKPKPANVSTESSSAQYTSESIVARLWAFIMVLFLHCKSFIESFVS